MNAEGRVKMFLEELQEDKDQSYVKGIKDALDIVDRAFPVCSGRKDGEPAPSTKIHYDCLKRGLDRLISG